MFTQAQFSSVSLRQMRAFCSDTDKVLLDILAEQWFLVYSSSGRDIHLRVQQLRQVVAEIDESQPKGAFRVIRISRSLEGVCSPRA